MTDRKKYGVVIADPAWKYHNAGSRGAAELVYPTMTVDEICALPVCEIVADDAVLLLWVTWPQLIEGLAVITAWGFEYVTGFPWVKIVGEPYIDLMGNQIIKPQYGIGFWVRGCTEPLLIAKRGNITTETSDLIGILSENLHHSRKPENIYHYAERYPGPYVEIFARRSRVGWDMWGNEVDSTAMTDVPTIKTVSTDVLAPAMSALDFARMG